MDTLIHPPGLARINAQPKSTETLIAQSVIAGSAENYSLQIKESKAKHEALMAELRERQIAASEKRRPTNQLLQKRIQLIEEIGRGEVQYAALIVTRDESLEKLNGFFGAEYIPGRNLIIQIPSALTADYILPKFLAWLESKKQSLAALENEIVRMATEHDVRDVLPRELVTV